MRRAALLAILLLAACGARRPGQQERAQADPSSAAAPTQTFKERAPPSDPPRAARFKAIGTEPFWSADLGGDILRYSEPEVSATDVPVRRIAGGTWIGTYDNKPLQLRIEKRNCSDGMSDNVYEYAAELKLGDRLLAGCARQGER